ncbi:MAG: RidA family protein [Sneathiella sp.]
MLREDETIRLAQLARSLPKPEPTKFAYIPVALHEKTAYLAGQIPKHDGALAHCGLVGDQISIEEAKSAACICAEQALSWFNHQAGGLENMSRILRLTYFIAHSDGFEGISEVADAASEYLVEVLGEIGNHSRSVIGVRSLPRNAPVLIEMTVALRQPIPEELSGTGISSA